MSAQGQLLDLVAPGWKGLNLQRKGQLLTPDWATKATNCVIDDSYRVACRAGYSVATTTPIGSTPNVEQIHEFRKGDGSVEMIVSWDGGIGNSLTDPSGSDISGAVTDTSGFWWFQNLNEKCIGFQDGQKPIVYTGAGSFATVVESSGTAPTSSDGVAMCAWGRVYALDSDGQTIKYSGLLDETDWGSASSGSIDMSKVWPGGMDVVTAIVPFNNSLLVFGKNQLVIWDDNTGSQLGFDPSQAIVVDSLIGVGCISQHTVQSVGDGDVLFVSRNGLQSLGRIIQERSNPLADVSKNVRDDLVAEIKEITVTDIRSTYYPEDGLYLLSFPTIGDPKTWVFDVKKKFQDDQDGSVVYPITQWDLAPYALCVRADSTLLMGDAGVVWTYGGDTDDSALIDYAFHTPWLDLGEELANRKKVLKRLQAIVYTGTSATVFFKWAVDFEADDQDTISRTVSASTASEFNIAEFGLGEFAGGLALQIIAAPARGTGQYFKLKLETSITQGFALQQYEIFAKIGRVA